MSFNKEIALDELSQVSGGAGVYGGSEKKLNPMPGCKVHQIAEHETLTGIAKKYGTTVAKIMAVNPTISDASKIRAGFYIYIPV